MEKKFYTDDFEQFLKDTADEFRMYPSKRVWNSLYNNLHPGRKWPSLSVCFLLISSIIFIGLAHKNEIAGAASSNVKNDILSTVSAPVKQNNTINQQQVTPIIEPTTNNNGNQLTRPGSITVAHVKRTINTVAHHHNFNNISRQAINNQQEENSIITNDTNNDIADINTSKSSSADQSMIVIPEPVNAETANENSNVVTPSNEQSNIGLTKNDAAVAVSVNDNKNNQLTVKSPVLAALKTNSPSTDKEWIDDYAFHHQPVSSLKSKLMYELYITPSIGFRSLNKNVSYSLPARSSSLVGNTEPPTSVSQSPAFNFEAGYNVIYPQSKYVRIKGGIQFNYTNYIVHAHYLGHSSTTTLLLNDPYSGGIELTQGLSDYANIPGENDSRLNSNTLQVSLPIGADIKIAGKHNLQWFVGATLQPTYVLFGNAYLISSDMKNYVYESKFFRKWNINGGVETFLSYKTKSGISFNAGPQFRYELFSTYSKRYSYDEKLRNVGVKVGVVRNF